ncbi:MAG: hypothetical protein MJ252_27635 [archaeon]|nr:hypothetical protein [archaeon]
MSLRKNKVNNFITSKRKIVPPYNNKNYDINIAQLNIPKEYIIDLNQFYANVSLFLILFLLAKHKSS